MRLAIITTHPIQYYAAIFQLMAKQIDVKVFYTWGNGVQEKFDPGFGKIISWDIPLLNGYHYQWMENTSDKPGSHHFKGIVNPDLIENITAWKADAVLIYGWSYHSHLKALRYFKNKIPVYFRGDSTLLDTKTGIRSLLKSLFLKWIYRHVDHAFYVGINNKVYFEKYGLKKEQLSFAPHAVDNDRFAEDRTLEATMLRQKLGIEAGEILVLFAGKLEDKKSPGLLLDAFTTLNMVNTHLLFVGNGVLEIELKTKASKHQNIHFMEFQNQSVMPAVYQASDIFCLPSTGPGETWGLSVNEAMAAGKAVLVSDKCGCTADLITPGYTGEVFEAGNLPDATSKLGTLLSDKTTMTILGVNAKKEIAGWNFEKQAKAVLTVINNVYAS
jgi:glycosyltransferase involved in cell wall biosynthesis